MVDYNYIKVFSEDNEPLYILRMEKGGEDEMILVDIFLENKVRFERTDLESYDDLINNGGEQYLLSAKELAEEHEARGFKSDGGRNEDRS
tara:strand:+ start:2566 stop:2835 length:270 start_codon:yes stop_codon:yes gene_type:complete